LFEILIQFSLQILQVNKFNSLNYILLNLCEILKFIEN